jgi:hypothetical protein
LKTVVSTLDMRCMLHEDVGIIYRIAALSMRAMASCCFCIGCGQSKEEAETFCGACKAAFIEIATEADSFSASCDSPEIEIATVRGSKRKLCPTESCAVCGLYLGATPAAPYCSVCASAMIEIASPEEATNSVPPPICGSIRRRLQFDAALGGVTVDLPSPKRLAALLRRNQKEAFIRNQKETLSSLERDDGNLSEQSQDSTPGSFCEVTDVLTAEDIISQRFVGLERDDRNLSEQSQDSTPGSFCEVTDVFTAEDVVSQRFAEATQNGEIVDLLSQEEFEYSELQ